DHGALAHEAHFARGSLRQVSGQEKIPHLPAPPAGRRRNLKYAKTRTGLSPDRDVGFAAGSFRPAVHRQQTAASRIIWRAAVGAVRTANRKAYALSDGDDRPEHHGG